MTPVTRRIHAVNFVRKLTVTTVMFLGPLHFLRLGFGGVGIGAILSALAFAPLLVSFPTGWVNDRFSIRRVVTAALLALSAAVLALGWVRSLPAIAALFLVLGVANNVLDVSMNSVYFKDESERETTRKYGVYLVWTALGPAAGFLLSGPLTALGGFRGLVVGLAILTAAAALVPRGFGRRTFAAVSLRDYRGGLLRRETALFAILLFAIALHWGVEGTVYAPFLRSRFGLGDYGLALYIGGAYLAIAASAFLVSRRPFGPAAVKRLFVLGLALSGAGHVLLLQTSVWISWAFRVVHESGDGLIGALTLLSIAGLFEKRAIGGSAGMMLALQTSGHVAGALVFSAMGQALGLAAPFAVSGGILLANAGYAAVILPSREAAGPSRDAGEAVLP